MKFSIVVVFLLGFTAVFAQPNREALALQDEEQFDLSFFFQYQDEAVFTVTFAREDNLDNIRITHSECQRNELIYDRQIADRYVYDQLLDFLQNINITSFQPTQNEQDLNAKLRVQGSINIQRTWTVNAFVFLYNPNNIGDENQILKYIVDVLKDNSNDNCSKKMTEQLEKYVEGTE
ncbi:MAG: hypothetical protein AB8G11_01325 [Saprospiraceae bacterium]